jgi:hypothetical protein
MNTQKYYETNGYYIFPNLVPHTKIDRLLNLYQRDIVHSRYPFFRQNINKYEPNQVNQFGYVTQSF